MIIGYQVCFQSLRRAFNEYQRLSITIKGYLGLSGLIKDYQMVIKDYQQFSRISKWLARIICGY